MLSVPAITTPTHTRPLQVRLSGLAASRIRIVRSGGRVAGADAAAGVAGDQNITFSDMYAEEARELLVEMELGQAAANGSQAVLQVRYLCHRDTV